MDLHFALPSWQLLDRLADSLVRRHVGLVLVADEPAPAWRASTFRRRRRLVAAFAPDRTGPCQGVLGPAASQTSNRLRQRTRQQDLSYVIPAG